MIRTGALVWFAIVAGAAAVDFSVSFEVQRLRDRLVALQRDVSSEQDTIRILRAEWAYLTQPARLRAMAEAYTDLSPILPEQMVQTAAVLSMPLRSPPAAEAGGAAPVGRSPGAAPLTVSMITVPGFGRAPFPGAVAQAAGPAAAPAAESMAEPVAGVAAAPPAATAPPAAPTVAAPAPTQPVPTQPAPRLPPPEDDPIGALLVSFQAGG